MPDPWPHLVVTQDGKRLLVNSFEEQDAAVAKGYFRNLGRIVERAEAKEWAEKAKEKDGE